MIESIILYSMVGVSIEIVFNAIRYSLKYKPYNYALKGEVSIWMFFIYGFGLTYGFDLIHHIMSYVSSDEVIRWLSYPLWIWAVEIMVGLPTKRNLWNYSDIKYNWKGVISIKHYPAWVAFGILIENLRTYTDQILL